MTRGILVDFNALPRVTRERFVNSTGPKPALAPVFADRRSSGGLAFLWAGLGAFSLFLLFILVMSNFGQPARGLVQPEGLIGVYIGVVFFLLAAGIYLVFQRKWRGVLPFQPGRYLLPFDFVDARSRQLRIIPLSDLAELQALHHHNNGVYSHSSISLRFHNNGSEEFLLHDKAKAEAQLRWLQHIRMACARALEQQDENTLREHDLFFEVRLQSGGFKALRDKAPDGAGGGPVAQELSRRLRKPFLFGLALVASGVLGPGIWFVRNLLSDDAAYAVAREDSSGKALAAYASHGWRYVDEARELSWQRGFQRCEEQDTEWCWKDFVAFWPGSPKSTEARVERLPRAALKATPRTVAGLKAFLTSYPDSVVDTEVRGQLLPTAAFQELPPNSVAELRRFRREYPSSVVDGEAQARIRQLFADSLAELQKQASTQNPQFIPFMKKLLTYLETTEQTQLPVRFRSHISASLRRADRLLEEDSLYSLRGGVAPVSGHFGASNTGPLEANTVKALKEAFQQMFPADLLTLEKGEPLTREQEATEAKHPRIDIDYTISWSGLAYRQESTGREFVGIQFDFDVTMRMPEAKPVRFSLKVKPPKNFTVQYFRPRTAYGFGDSAFGPSDYTVYDVMAQRAFDELGGKLGKVFFRADSKAFLALSGTPP